MTHRSVRGTIRYTSKQPQRMDCERGREYFTITQQDDGMQVLHAHCEIDDEPAVLRDVLLSLDRDWQPRECVVRLSVGGRHEGTGFMRFTEQHAQCRTFDGQGECTKQQIELSQPLRWLGAHPLCGDALCLRLYDRDQGPGREFFPQLMLTSPDHRGATGPELFLFGCGVQYLGEEQVSVGAGRFDALHFRFIETAGQLPQEHPPYDIWCTADGEYLFLKGEVGGYMQTAYELTELQR